MTDLLWLVIALPLLGAVVNLFFGKRLGEPVAGGLSVGVVVASWAIAVPATLSFVTGSGQVETIYLFSWIPVVGADAAILWDPLSAVMTMIVTGVGALIHIYSLGYMRGDERYPRFFAFLNLFIASMMILVLSANFAMMFVGWELVGLSSYLLISFWFTKPEAAAAGKKAFIVNRIGDWGFLVALMIIFATFGTFDFGTIFTTAPGILTVGAATAITLLLFVGAAGKSAQIPLYIWLPDAMEGPTPVSALIHAATMVTAGVFMIARAAVLFELAPVSGAVIAVVGTLTALVAALIAVSQTDIKKVLAYSTISQLGFMVLAVGVGAYTAGVFHLATHAFFKALLFLGAGSVIHAMAGEQDMRKMGGLRKMMPVTFITMAIGWLAISGIFPFAGFWSKDEILAATFAKGGAFIVLWAVGLFVALLTAFYMTRMFVMTFLGRPRWDGGTHPHESPATMTVPLIVLGFFSVSAGLVNTPARLAFEHFLEPSFVGVPHIKGLTLGLIVTLAVVSLVVALAGVTWGWLAYRRDELPAEDGAFWRRSLEAFAVDDFYGRVIVAPGKRVSTWAAETMDPRVIDGAAHGVARGVLRFGSVLGKLQTGQVRGYAGGMAVAGVILIFVFLAVGGGF
ncbi:MAG: NADH-quinone oxidoreductase subunit L [Actinomycetota bacterium]|nr:NADH-quinone oxidoreductase subunit L [Actinomycetota bacterium]MDK1016852.1 NADH-quinone oxidoreductase subunit L [Actinomycetota bacterium]MDK1026707.1 NADH-quinone oxidoreductase subunit L [Actinomycetota bacterium]MDK1038326.1 NADH-quinone oxidoreductase subunit L [Actinomycetota bacterium]MDK1097055.1 NADH-quinone oxidoreductase subunit L [Actinomycetota bacterium]